MLTHCPDLIFCLRNDAFTSDSETVKGGGRSSGMSAVERAGVEFCLSNLAYKWLSRSGRERSSMLVAGFSLYCITAWRPFHTIRASFAENFCSRFGRYYALARLIAFSASYFADFFVVASKFILHDLEFLLGFCIWFLFWKGYTLPHRS